MYLKKEFYELIRTDESIFNFILEGALDGLWYWDLENPENEYLNAKFWTVLGYNPDEMPHKSSAWQDIINKEDLEVVMENFTKHCENPNHPYDQIVRYTHKNGSTVWIRCRGFAIRDNNGKPIRMLGAHHDVTELKRSEQALLKASEMVHESEEKYRAFYNNAPLSYQSLDENGCFIDINPMWSKTLGFGRDEVIGKWYGDFLHPDYVEHFRTNFPSFKKRGYFSDVQFKLRRKDNTYIYVSFESCVGYTPEGKFKQTYCVFKDITEQKALENAIIKAKEKAEENEAKQRTLSESLKQERLLLRTIIDSIPDSIYVKDLESRKVLANKTNLHNCGVEKEEDVIGKTDFDFFTTEIAEKLFDDDNRVLKEGVSIINKEECIKRPHFDEKCLLTSKLPLYDDTGKIIGLVGIGHDITERKRAEEKLKTSDRIFKHSLDMLCIAGFDGYFKVLNPAWTKILGWSNEELLSKPWIDFVHPDERDNANDVKTVIVEGKEIYQFENRYMCKDGTIKWLSWNSFPYPEENIMFGVARDVTVSKHRELIINNFFEQPMNLNLIADFVGKINRVNSGWEFYLGYQKDEIIGNNFFDFIHLDDIAITIEEMKKLEKGISTLHFENRYKHKNGEYRNLLWSAINSLDEHLIYAVAIDITERKRAETQLVVSEQKLKEAQRIAHMGNWELNIETNELFWSDEIFRIFNCEPQEFKATYEAFLGFVHPDDREMVNSAYLKSLQIKTGYQIEHRVLIKNNHIKFVREKCSTTFNEQGKALISFGIVIDITEQKQAEQELKIATEKATESKKLFKSLIENAPDGIVIIDEQGKYKFVSPNAERLFGYNKDEAIGLSGAENTHPDDLPMVLKALETIYADPGKKPKLEYRFKRKNGEFRWIETTFTNLLSDRAINGIVLNFSDITERKQIFEELIITKEKAEESDRLKSAFLANMSHEIRTPMNGILGFSDLLKKPNLAGEEQQKYISIIEKSGKRMLSIINDIIDISKIEAGYVELNMNESNINEMIEFVYTFFKPEAETKKIKLSYKTPLPLKEATIKTDSEKIYSVLTNLVKNAIKYTEKGEIELGYVHKRDQIEFYVKDTGIGIPKERQEAIFERFIQADIQDKMARQGAGLGLAISKAYVDMLGGVIQVESEEGKGSTFHFTLPCNTESENETIDRQPERSDRNDDIRKLKTLIVEDDEISEMLLDETVKIFSKEILNARTGVEAVQACRDNPDIDLILMDIQMPIINGYEATKQIREFNKEVIIIAQTAYGLSGDKQKSIDAGCNDYISKPIEKDKLLALTQKYFGK